MKRLKVFTWQIHGNYLYYLSHVPHDIYVPFRSDRSGDYAGCFDGFPWPDNIINVPIDRIRELELDCILFQRSAQYLADQYEVLTEAQRLLPRIYLEHDPPREHPTDARHIVQDGNVLLVHVTSYNRLMWDNGNVPTKVIDHGIVVPPDVQYTGEIPRGLVIVNNIQKRGRRLGLDLFQEVRTRVPLDLIGIGSEAVGGLGEISHDSLPRFETRYRFLFNPIRYTSLGLAVCEAMLLGMPVVGIASTEMARTVEHGVSGYIDTDIERRVKHMNLLIADHGLAQRLGQGARVCAQQRFNIHRFVQDWNEAFSFVTG
jgi:glycosyltransferase involved in cell wall biosynthesis